MHNLYFGARARRRQRLKRLVVPAWLLSVAALALGVPGAEGGLDLLSRLDDRSTAVVHAITNPPSRDQIGSVDNTEATLRFRRATFNSRPVPERSPSEPTTEPTAPPASAPEGSITEIIYAAAAEFGIDGGYLLGVAHCESALNPQAHSPAGYHGLFPIRLGDLGRLRLRIHLRPRRPGPDHGPAPGDGSVESLAELRLRLRGLQGIDAVRFHRATRSRALRFDRAARSRALRRRAQHPGDPKTSERSGRSARVPPAE